MLAIAETWRSEREEVVRTQQGHSVYMSGGSTSTGVGIAVDHLCALHFSMGKYVFRLFSAYFPTSWDAQSEIDVRRDFGSSVVLTHSYPRFAVNSVTAATNNITTSRTKVSASKIIEI